MTTVYLDPWGTLVETSQGRRLGDEYTTLLAGGLDAVARLRAERYDVVVLSGPIVELAELGDAVRFEPLAPDQLAEDAGRGRQDGPASRSWLISADESWSELQRPPGMRTIHVGPRRPDPRRPTARFDVEARDLTAAVLEILVQDTLET